MSMTTWDTETGIKSRFKRKASPFGAGNNVVVHGWKHRSEPNVVHHYFGRHTPNGWLAECLQVTEGPKFGTKLLCGFNIKFDLLHALQDKDNLDLWMSYVTEGGQVWDCQLAEYLLNGMGQRDQMLSLDEVAPRYGGNVKIDEVKALWEAGVDTIDIDPELLIRYLVGGADETGRVQKGDVENTEAVAIGQIARARAQGQLNSILLNMGSLLCTIEMERNGMFIDVALGLKLADALRIKVGEMKVELEKFLPADMPFDFKWTSRFHKSALIFGGTVNWDGHEYDLAAGGTVLKHVYDMTVPYGAKYELLYSQKDELHYILADGSTMECEAYDKGSMDAAFDGTPFPDLARNKGGKNAGEAKTKLVKVNNLDKPKGRGVKVPYTFKGFTAPEKKWESADKGFYSTAADVIEELGFRDVPFLQVMSELMAMTKDLGTYYIVTDPETGEQKGMLSLVDEHGLIHHRINHTNTITGRFSSSDPNLQNVSGGAKSDVKLVFVSRFGPDGKIIQSDFSSLEVYVQAILTRCTQLIKDLQAGLDMHCVRVSQKEGIDYDLVYKYCHGYKTDDGVDVPADPVWVKKRKNAKVFSFQRAYGAGAKKIAAFTGMTVEEVEALILAEGERYPEIDDFYVDATATIKANRRPGITLPHPEFPGVMCNLGTSSYTTPDGKLYTYQEQPSPDYLVKKGISSSFSPTEIKNYFVQGGGGEWAKAAMWLALREFYRHRNWAGFALLVNQVHDALYADADATVAAEAAAVLHACMEAASDFMEFYFKWEVPVPVPSETTWGASMMNEEKIVDIKSSAGKLRQGLRDRYMGGYKPSFLQ